MTNDAPLIIIPGKTECLRCARPIHAEPTPDDSYLWVDTETGQYCGDLMHDPKTAPLYFDSYAEEGERFIPMAGQRVQLREEVNRYPHFIAPKGATGTITEATTDSVAITMDERLEGAEEWANAIVWDVRNPEEMQWLAEDIRPLGGYFQSAAYDAACEERSYGDPFRDEDERPQG
jgi:hypothetical protein